MCDCAFAFSWEPPIFLPFLKKGMLFVWEGISMYEYCVLLSLQRTCGVLFTVYNVGQISTTRRQICWRFGVTVKMGKSLIDTLIKEVDKKVLGCE